jgi:endonuclease-3
MMLRMAKRPLDIDEMMVRLRTAVAPFRKAAMFELAEDGYTSLFEQLVACIISIRTYDEETLPIAQLLFDRARTPAAMARLSVDEITALIRPSTFCERKAAQIRHCADGAGKTRRRAALREGSPDGVRGGRAQVRAPGSRRGLPSTLYQRGYSRASCNQPVGIRLGSQPRRHNA